MSKTIPLDESFAEWRKDPKYIEAYDALENEFSFAAALIESLTEACEHAEGRSISVCVRAADQRGRRMTVFRLDPNPATLNDPRWQASSIRECVWVSAENPDEARKKVAFATLEFRAPKPGTSIVRSPWYDDAFAICVMDPSRTDVPDDAVIKADGTKLE